MAGKPSTKLFYKIGEVCRLTDIKPHILRYWESEFPALNPSKSRGGQRVYQQKDLDTVRRIKRMLYEEGYTIAGAKKKLSGAKETTTGHPVKAGEGICEPQSSHREHGNTIKDDARLADAIGKFKQEIKELLEIISN